MIEMLHCDCMDYMRGLPDKAFELAIVDPNYRDNNQPTKDMRKNGSMTSLSGRPTKEYWNNLFRVSKIGLYGALIILVSLLLKVL